MPARQPPKFRILLPSFFERPALVIARELLGKYLVRRFNGVSSAHMITETEAYIGPQDLASHASKGLTPRTKIMFGTAGHFYVYFTYGMHWMLNIVTDKQDYPAAVLIRGLEDISGPARLTKSLKIDKALNGASAVRRSGLWIEDRGAVIPARHIRRTPRVGVAYAGKWAEKPYRFLLVDKAAFSITKKS